MRDAAEHRTAVAHVPGVKLTADTAEVRGVEQVAPSLFPDLEDATTGSRTGLVEPTSVSDALSDAQSVGAQESTRRRFALMRTTLFP